MNRTRTGNAISEGAKRKGWFVGQFMPESDLTHTSDLEVKWGVHKKGHSNLVYTVDRVSTSLCLLISGQLRLEFRHEGEYETVVLTQQGDYVLWLPAVEHLWVAESENDTVVITIRWPSSRPDVQSLVAS